MVRHERDRGSSFVFIPTSFSIHPLVFTEAVYVGADNLAGGVDRLDVGEVVARPEEAVAGHLPVGHLRPARDKIHIYYVSTYINCMI